MTWLLSIVSGILCAAAGAFAAGYIADLCVEWYNISGREGNSGYFVVMIGLLGLIAGLIIGFVSSRFFAGLEGGFVKGLGAGLGVVVVGAAVGWMLARAFGDVPPKLRGSTLNIMVELRCPKGWAPSNKVKQGLNWVTLRSISNANVQRSRSERGALSLSEARLENGLYTIPGFVYLFTSTGKRVLSFALAEKDVASFLTPLPAHPGKNFEQWSDWQPKVQDGPEVAGGYRYRFRVKRTDEVQAEGNALYIKSGEARRQEFARLQPGDPLEKWLPFLERDSADPSSYYLSDLAGSAGEVIRQRHAEMPNVLASISPEQTNQALLGVQALNEVPDTFIEPLRHVAAAIATNIRRFRESLDPNDPDTLAAERIKQSYFLWKIAWDRAASNKNLPPPPELETIENEASEVKKIPEIEAIASQAKIDFTHLSEAAKH